RIGEGLTPGGMLNGKAVERTIAGLKEFKKEMDALEIENAWAVATSALREAGNAGEFIRMTLKQSGIDIEIISGHQEAILSYQGVIGSLPLSGKGARIVIDVGGGSTELALKDSRGFWAESYPVGAVRCWQHSMDENIIREILRPGLEKIKSTVIGSLVAVGGTATTLAAMEQSMEIYDPGKIHGTVLGARVVRKWLTELSALTIDQRKNIPGLQPQRADIISHGITILWVIISELSLETITISEADLLYGMIIELAAE
ncbi:MAG: Ppx/GppA phosphatase family protein, partial [Bacillota bacterium]